MQKIIEAGPTRIFALKENPRNSEFFPNDFRGAAAF